MIVSIEPGYYEKGCFGVRLENLYVIVPADATAAERQDIQETAGSEYLRFAPLTLVPFQINLIDIKLLERRHICWLNEYHERVQREITPIVMASHNCRRNDVCRWISDNCTLVVDN